MRSERCRVVIKARPTSPHEEEALGDSIKLTAPGRVNLVREFESDRVYLPQDGDDAVYDDEVKALVASLYEGINATVFAYGASGAGKTHTVLGSKNSPGLVDRIIDDVFAQYDQRSCTVAVSVEELYCERFTDLLAATEQHASNSSSRQQQHRARSVHFKPPPHHRDTVPQNKYTWQKVTLSSGSDMKALVHHTLRKRHTASTCLNEKSSRSHVIVTITVEQRKEVFEHKQPQHTDEDDAATRSSGGSSSSSTGGSPMRAGSQLDDGSDERSVSDYCSVTDTSSEAGSVAPVSTYLIGKLYLVDLAGSENIKRSGAEGTRQKEAGEINKSLCHLKTVIEEVFKGGRVTTYRNSKLTFRLQDALGGGNSRLLVVACISTAKSNLQETKETLRFAEMARAITNTPVVNREPKDELIHRLQLQLAELQDQLKAAKEKGGRAEADELLQQQLNAVEAAYADLQEEMEAKEARWMGAAVAVKDQVNMLSELLSASQGREASLKQQMAADRTTLQTLQQQLLDEQGVRQGSQQAGEAAALLLLGVNEDLTAVQLLCGSLHQQLDLHQVAASRAAGLCAEQQQQVQQLQGQLAAQAKELAALQQKLHVEQVARAAAEGLVKQLQQQLQEQHSTARELSVVAAAELQQLAALCAGLQQQTAAAALQHLLAEQQSMAIARGLQAAEGEQQQLEQELQAARAESRQQEAQQTKLQQQLEQQQQQHKAAEDAAALAAAQYQTENEVWVQVSKVAKASIEELQQQLEQQKRQHKAERDAAAAAAAEAAASAAAEHKQQREAWAQELKAAQATAVRLQQQLEDETAEHEAVMAAERLRHSQQLAESMQSSVKKLTADKLRCREHLSLQVHNIMADAQSLSEALASSCLLPDVPDSPANSSSSSSRNRSSLSGSLHLHETPAAEASCQDVREVEGTDSGSTSLQTASGQGLPPLRLYSSPEPSLPDIHVEVPMQDASELRLGRLTEDGTESECSSRGSRMHSSRALRESQGPGCSVAATDSKCVSPSRVVKVHVRAGVGNAALMANLADGRHTRPHSRCDSEGAPSRSAADTVGSSQSHSRSRSWHPSSVSCSADHALCVDARSSAAAAAGASCVGSSSWPSSYLPKEEVDMVAAALAFAQLRGGVLCVDALQSFLEHRMLGGKLHSKTLCGGQRKRKHELVQDMLAYHKWHCSAQAGQSSTAATAAKQQPHHSSSKTKSGQDSSEWHPLGSHAATKAAATAGCHLSGAATTTNTSSSQKATQGWHSCEPSSPAAFAVASAGTSSVQLLGSAEQQQQGAGGGSPGLWSWLTPGRRSKQSILAQLQATAKQQQQQQQQQHGLKVDSIVVPGGSDAVAAAQLRRSADHRHLQQQQQKPQQKPHPLSLELPDADQEEASFDAVSPRDKRHAAAAATAGKLRGSGSGSGGSCFATNSSTSPAGPRGGAIALNGRAISACTGSAVNEFYVDSPAVKLAPSGSNKQRQDSSSTTTNSSSSVRLSVEVVPAAHRSNWRQVQLTRSR